MKIEQYSISIRFFKITDPWVGRSFSMYLHDPIFGTNKNRILINGSCERAFIELLREVSSGANETLRKVR